MEIFKIVLWLIAETLIITAILFQLSAYSRFKKLYLSTATRASTPALFGAVTFSFAPVTEEQKMWIKQKDRYNKLSKNCFVIGVMLFLILYIPKIVLLFA